VIRACAILGLALCATAPHAWAQQPQPTPPPSVLRQQPPEPEEEESTEQRGSPLLRIPVIGPTLAPSFPALSGYPLELLGLLMAPLERREVNLIPAFAITEEFNDNFFLNNDNKRYEFITGLTPSISLLANRPRFQLAAGFSNTSELYGRGSTPNDAFARQNLIVGTYWQPTPQLTFTLADTMLRDQSASATAGGFALGGQGSTTNALTPTMGWQLAPQTRLDLGATYSLIRFDGRGAGIESDTYGFMSNLSHGLTPRFSGMVGYNFTYIDLRSGHGDNSTTHNPTLGFAYRLTPTLTLSIDGGPAFTHLGSEDFITPGVSAGIVQRLPFGSASVFYSESVGVAGGFGGPTDNKSIIGTLVVAPLKDLIVIFNPAWTKAESLSDRQIERVDVGLFTLGLGAAYRLNHYVTLFGGYSFLLQRVGRFSTTQDFDADQNRVKVGVQFGYPFAFDLGR
jgi:hypothetical protein